MLEIENVSKFRRIEQDDSEINGQRNIFSSYCDPLRAIHLGAMFSTDIIKQTRLRLR